MAKTSSQLYPSFRQGIAADWRRLSGIGASSQPHAPGSHSCSLHEAVPRSTIRDELLANVEAALLTADEPLSPRQLAKLAELADTGEARRQIGRLNSIYLKEGSGFYVEEIAGGYQLLTRPQLRPWLGEISRVHEDLQLSGPALETLAIVAYRQPICRADIEAIRGVQVGELLKQLMERGLVRFAGKDDSLGRPFLYGTTKRFLEVFGLRNLHELPLVELLTKPKPPEQAASSPTESESDRADELDDESAENDVEDEASEDMPSLAE